MLYGVNNLKHLIPAFFAQMSTLYLKKATRLLSLKVTRLNNDNSKHGCFERECSELYPMLYPYGISIVSSRRSHCQSPGCKTSWKYLN